MHHRLFLIVLLTSTALSTPTLCDAEEVLPVAKRLAKERFDGWKYGSKSSEMQIDCVQFVLAVTEEALAQSLNAKTRSQILISNLSEEEKKNLATLVESESDKIKGIQHALASIGRGHAIEPKNAKSGDFVQYWMKKNDGSWFGHAGILEKVEKVGNIYQATVFGAHKSTNGIATSKFKLRLSGPTRKVFIVRVK